MQYPGFSIKSSYSNMFCLFPHMNWCGLRSCCNQYFVLVVNSFLLFMMFIWSVLRSHSAIKNWNNLLRGALLCASLMPVVAPPASWVKMPERWAAFKSAELKHQEIITVKVRYLIKFVNLYVVKVCKGWVLVQKYTKYIIIKMIDAVSSWVIMVKS